MKSLVFYTGWHWHKWDWRSIETKGIGGSETAVINMTRELSRRGNQCKVFADVVENSIDPQSGAEYISYLEWEQFAAQAPIDVLIISRNLKGLLARHSAKKVIGWIHDVTMYVPEEHAGLLELPDKYFVLSPWHQDYVHETQKIPKSKLILTSNGVDPQRYQRAGEIAKDRFSSFYSSSPERGLERLIDALPAIRQHVPNFTLHVCNDFEVAAKWITMSGSQAQKEMLPRLKQKLQNAGVAYHGQLNQSQLAEIQMKCGMWLYPTDFAETSCITAMEAGFARCPIVTAAVAGLAHTAGGNAIMLTKGNLEEFVTEVARLCYDDSYYEYWQRMALEGMRRYTWSAVADQWMEILGILCTAADVSS